MLPPGTILAQFRITSQLGTGGMGEVYLADDTRLGRSVALKILPTKAANKSEQAGSAARRLMQEARAASALNHPNVATIYEIGEAGDIRFIAMEYVEGDPLNTRIAGRPLAASAIVPLGIQAADALAEAHAKGIIHRDIKPGNIMITPRGQVKILDFGLAKITAQEIEEDATQSMTQPGTVMGTAKYMSPEQALGRPLDNRTDIFSLGVVLYEMTTGRPPFSGNTAAETLDSILHASPEPIARLHGGIPPELERIIGKCLEKDRDRRYQSARELQVDLRNLQRDTDSAVPIPSATAVRAESWFSRRRVVAGLPVALLLLGLGFYWMTGRDKAIDSIAVLPFVNASGNPDTEYLSDGITDSLITGLAQLPRLRVTARSLVFRHKGKEEDPQKAGRDLKVRAVLMGRVVQRGDSLNVQAELMDVDSGAQLWGERYNRKLADLLTVQEEIAKEISERLRLRLTGEEQKRLTMRYTENVEAYQAYLRGRYQLYRYTAEGMRRGIEFLNRAIELEPKYAQAYAGLAEAYVMYAGDIVASSEALPRARTAAAKALEIDDTLAEAHNAMGMVKYNLEWDWTGAEREFRRAGQLNPNYATAHDWYGSFLALMGRTEEAVRELKRAVELDPLTTGFLTDLGDAYRFGRRPDEAILQHQNTIKLEPNFWPAYLLLAAAYRDKGDFPAALAALQKGRALEDDIQILAIEADVLARSGQSQRARALLREVAERSKKTPLAAVFTAIVLGDLGDKDEAFEWLEKGFQERAFMPFLKSDPGFDSLRSDPRFTDILRRMGFP
jgi:eukaryotic-like serine/threonine-protein kinase